MNIVLSSLKLCFCVPSKDLQKIYGISQSNTDTSNYLDRSKKIVLQQATDSNVWKNGVTSKGIDVSRFTHSLALSNQRNGVLLNDRKLKGHAIFMMICAMNVVAVKLTFMNVLISQGEMTMKLKPKFNLHMVAAPTTASKCTGGSLPRIMPEMWSFRHPNFILRRYVRFYLSLRWCNMNVRFLVIITHIIFSSSNRRIMRQTYLRHKGRDA